MNKKKIIFIFLLLAFWLFGVWGGYYYGKLGCDICPPEEVDFSLFWQAWKALEEKFIDKENFNAQEIIYGAISGMTGALKDSYTVFFNPEDAKIFNEDVKGSFEGLGMEVAIRKGQLQVISPLEGTPAQKAGLRAGDKILKIDSVLTVNLTIDEAVRLMRGPRGTEVVLTIYRDEWKASQEVKIVRQVIEIPSLNWGLKNGNIAYIELYNFNEKANVDFNIAAVEILASPAKKIILDLRNNPGGYLTVAQDIAGWFIERGDVVVIEDFGQAKEQVIYKSRGPSSFASYPIVVLINQGSASASEILAGALRDNRNIKLIGETSFGKGSIQELERLKGGSFLKITVAKWLTPSGILISEMGLKPDIEIELTDEDYESEKDPQLDKAIEIIRDL